MALFESLQNVNYLLRLAFTDVEIQSTDYVASVVESA